MESRVGISVKDLLSTQPPGIIWLSSLRIVLHGTPGLVIDITKFLAVVLVIGDIPTNKDKVAFRSPSRGKGNRGQAVGDALAEGRGLGGEGVEGQVLAVAVPVPSPGGDDEVCEEDEEDEGDYGGDYESLRCAVS